MERPFSAYAGDEPYLFVSYSRADAEIVFPELSWLRNQGCNVWYDDGIRAGAEWPEELAAAIKGADRFLLLATPNSVGSRNCRDELRLAIDLNIPIVVAHLEPAEITGGLQLQIGSNQAILKYELSASSYKKKILAALGAGGSTHGETDTQFNSSPSIAILPFVNMSDDPEQEYFSDGMTEEIINGLVKSSNLKVIARTSSFQFKGQNRDIRDIGRRLNVNHVLEGSVRKSANRIYGQELATRQQTLSRTMKMVAFEAPLVTKTE